MRRNVHPRHRLVLLGGIVLALVAPPSTRAAIQPPSCQPLVQFHGGIVACYSPAQRRMAELQLTAHPINPVSIVGQTIQVPLTQVLVLRGTPGGSPGPAHAIVYVFGMIPGPSRGLLSHSPVRPLYAVVQETIGRTMLVGVQIVPEQTAAGGWSLRADIPHSDLSLHVISNVTRQRVLRIGQGILQAAK